MSYHPASEFEFNQISQQIFVGTNMCCQSHYQEKLLSQNISVDISLEAEHVDQPYGAEYFIWIPIIDHSPPTIEQMRFGAKTIAELVAMGKKIYIHCKEGHGRAPTMTAAYFISTGMSTNEALALIQQYRPEAHPNQEQVKALEQFEELFVNGKK